MAEWPSGLGKGLQSPVRGFDSRFRLAGRARAAPQAAVLCPAHAGQPMVESGATAMDGIVRSAQAGPGYVVGAAPRLVIILGP